MFEGIFVAYLVNIVKKGTFALRPYTSLCTDLEKDWLISDTEHKVVEGVPFVTTPATLENRVTID